MELRETLIDIFPEFNVVAWSVACREMSVRAAHGNYEAAVDVLKRFFQSTQRDFVTLDSHVGMAFPIRTANMLEQNGYCTVRSVKSAGPNRIMSTICNVGPKTVDEIFRIIQQVENHELLEPIGDDELDLIDESDFATGDEIQSYEQRIKQSRKMNGMSSISTNNVGGGSAVDKIKSALAVITADQSQTIQVLDQEIGELEQQLDELKKLRRMLNVTAKPVGRPRKVSEKVLSNEELIYQYLMSNGGSATIADISEALELIPIQVGKAIAQSKRLEKNDKIITAR